MTSDEATPEQDLPDWEFWLRVAAKTGTVLDLAGGDVEVLDRGAASLPEEWTIPAAALRAVLTDPDLVVDPKGLHIRAARFLERVELDHLTFEHPLTLSWCALDAGLSADGARLRDLNLYMCALGGVRAFGATIDGQLNLQGSIFKNRGDVALALDGVKVSGNVFADNGFQAEGRVSAIGASIDGTLRFDGATLDNSYWDALVLDGVKVGRDVIVGGVNTIDNFRAVGGISAAGAIIAGKLDLSGVTVTLMSPGPRDYALNLVGAEIGGLESFLRIRRRR